MAMRPGYACDAGGVNAEIRPGSIAPPAADYALAVLTEAPNRWLHTAGIVPVAPDGTVPGELPEQARIVWANIGALLDAAGLAVTDIVSVTTYVVAGEELADVMAARDEFMAGHRAASTLVTVPALARPEWRVEIAIVAAA
jgi:2-iminobutanoate/2-iminopropanoate deaminase